MYRNFNVAHEKTRKWRNVSFGSFGVFWGKYVVAEGDLIKFLCVLGGELLLFQKGTGNSL